MVRPGDDAPRKGLGWVDGGIGGASEEDDERTGFIAVPVLGITMTCRRRSPRRCVSGCHSIPQGLADVPCAVRVRREWSSAGF